MTSYMTNNLWRHVIPKQHQLVQLSITWHKSRDIISVRYHEMKVITPKKPGTSGSVIFGKKIQTILGTSGSVISGKIIQKWLFRVIWLEKNSFLNYRILGTELASFLEKKSRRLFFFRNSTRWYLGCYKPFRNQFSSMGEYLFQILNGIFCYLLNLGSKKPFSGKEHKWHKLNGHADFLTQNRLVNQLRKRPTCIMNHNKWYFDWSKPLDFFSKNDAYTDFEKNGLGLD